MTRCEWCGAEYDDAAGRRPPRPAPPRTAPPPAPAADGAETHCEWCGAEYPVPEGGD